MIAPGTPYGLVSSAPVAISTNTPARVSGMQFKRRVMVNKEGQDRLRRALPVFCRRLPRLARCSAAVVAPSRQVHANAVGSPQMFRVGPKYLKEAARVKRSSFFLSSLPSLGAVLLVPTFPPCPPTKTAMSDVSVPTLARVGQPYRQNVHWFRSTTTQAVILGLTAFTCPGLWVWLGVELGGLLRVLTPFLPSCAGGARFPTLAPEDSPRPGLQTQPTRSSLLS